MKKYPQPTKTSSRQPSSKTPRKTYTSTERVIDSVPYPPVHLLTIKDIFGTSG